MRAQYMVLPLICVGLLLSCNGNKGDTTRSAISVKVVKAERDTLFESASYSGVIEESSGVALSFATSGTVKALFVDDGVRVQKGQELGVLDGKVQESMLETAKSALSISKESLSQAEDMAQRMSELHDEGSLPEVQWIDVQTKLEQAKQTVKAAESQVDIAEKSLSDCHLVAPFSGFISSKMVEMGQNVSLGMPIVKLVNIDRVKAKCSVPEREIESVSVGQTMKVRVSALANRVFDGVVCEKSVSADPLSRTYSVSVLLNNSDGKLLPGMLCSVLKVSEGDSENVVLPARVVLIDDTNKPFVWVVKEEKAQQRHISLGANHGELVVINSGLEVGERVISDGSQKISDGMNVTFDK